ncbi:hypothetical protein C8R46DRAFT_1354165 [Mycena filopes]|nr:hypothetical protein C8R46DRAFT_1354165 [Mycena filopes]
MSTNYETNYYSAPGARPTPFLSSRRFARLSTILADANARYTAVAAANRAARAPTHHARTRAAKLELSVDIKRAVNCPERQGKDTQLHTRGRPTLRVVVPQPDVPTSGSYPYSTLELTSALAHPAPTVLRGQNVPWRGPTSRFSLTPSDPIFMIAPRRAPAAPVVPDVPFDDFTDLDLDDMELEYPQSGAADYAESAASFASSGSDSSSYTSSPESSRSEETSPASSRGPATPADVIPGFTFIHVNPAPKRKSSERDDTSVLPAVAGEKRPKYERKSWARGRQLC